MNAAITLREDTLSSYAGRSFDMVALHSLIGVFAHELGHCWENVAGGGSIFMTPLTARRYRSGYAARDDGDLYQECNDAWRSQGRHLEFETLNYPLSTLDLESSSTQISGALGTVRSSLLHSPSRRTAAYAKDVCTHRGGKT